MTRLDELTLKLIDSDLSDAEALELDVALSHDTPIREAHERLLEVEASLRAERTNLDLAQATMARLRTHLAEALNNRVMAEVRTGPAPQWLRRGQLATETK